MFDFYRSGGAVLCRNHSESTAFSYAHFCIRSEYLRFCAAITFYMHICAHNKAKKGCILSVINALLINSVSAARYYRKRFRLFVFFSTMSR